ncbi:MAG: NDP-sugar synthase [Thermoleophilaceae bacterium]
MQALVLAGGEGTRLRPLTLDVPKPVLPLAGRPFLGFMLDWLGRHGVDDVLLSCGFLSDAVEDALGHDWRGMRLRYVHEHEPLGTAGPLRLALDEGLLAERLYVLNGDVLCDFDLTEQRCRHEATGALATIALAEVGDTAGYGVVPTADDGQVEAFIEKQPGPAPTNRINAGCYLLGREVAEGIDAGRAVSMERDVFPRLCMNGLYGFHAEGYWMDIGTPERYLEATWDLLAGRVASDLPPRDETGSLVAAGSLTSGARIGPQAVVGSHCSVGAGSVVERAVLHDSVTVGADCMLAGCILAGGVRVGNGARVEDGAIVGSRAVIEAGRLVHAGARVQPGERVV